MSNSAFWDPVVRFTSWLIVGGLIWAVISLFIQAPSGAGPVAQVLGTDLARWFYIALYVSEASILAYAKALKKNRLRKQVLLAIYLSAVFTFILSMVIVGFDWKIIDNLIIAIAAGICWVYWKFKVDYVSVDNFDAEIASFRRRQKETE